MGNDYRLIHRPTNKVITGDSRTILYGLVKFKGLKAISEELKAFENGFDKELKEQMKALGMK